MIDLMMPMFVDDPLAEAQEVVAFWKNAGPKMWFAKDADFDRRFRERFLAAYEAAARGELSAWLRTPESAFALVLLLDQFPRNAFRDTPRMYATDELARSIGDQAIALGYDRLVEEPLQFFFYLPFGHSESLLQPGAAEARAGPSRHRASLRAFSAPKRRAGTNQHRSRGRLPRRRRLRRLTHGAAVRACADHLQHCHLFIKYCSTPMRSAALSLRE